MNMTSSKVAQPKTYRYEVLYKDPEDKDMMDGMLNFVETNPASSTTPIIVILSTIDGWDVLHREDIKNSSRTLFYVGETYSVGAFQVEILSEGEIVSEGEDGIKIASEY